jgi:hypothetical protein
MDRRSMRALVWGVALFVGACGGDGGGGGGGNAGGAADMDPFASGGNGSGGDAGPNGGGPGGGAGGDAPVGGSGPDLNHCTDDPSCPNGYYCDRPADAETGACKPGCRQSPNDCNEPYLCDDTHACVLDMRCMSDSACPPNTYCSDGDCVEGCKVTDPDECPLTMDGRRQLCDPDTRDCTVAVVCCAADDSCSATLPGACRGDALEGVLFCTNPNPCEGRCAADDDCPDEQYCGADGHCALGCRLDMPRACPGGQFCNADTHACGFRSCGSDAECPNTQFCGPAGQCATGCRTEPDNCPQGSYCQENRECGAGCQTDELCVMRNGPGWYCADFQCHRPCAAHGDCAEGEFCNADTARCEIGCRDDDQEPNDNIAGARPLVFANGTHFDSGLMALNACQLDSDFFQFETPEDGWEIHARLEFSHAAGDLDFRLYDADDQSVAESSGAADDEDIRYPVAGSGVSAPAGHWTLEVQPRGLAENTYRLVVDLAPPGGCLPDDGESAAGDDSAINATSLSLPQLQQETTIENHSICPGDDDWYAVRMGARDGLSVRLDAAAGMGDLDFAVFGPGAPTPDTQPVFRPNVFQQGNDGTRTYAFEIPRFNAAILDGTYYIRVLGANAEQTARYTLTVGVDRDRALCQDDLAEPNDQLNRAFDLMGRADLVRPRFDGNGTELVPDVDLTVPDLWLCSGEQDWFRFDVTANDEIVARVVRQDAVLVGDTRIEIRDARGQVVGLAGRNNQAENVARARQLAAGTYYVSVSGVAMTQTQYSLVLNRTTSPIPCQDDVFERGGGNEQQLDASLVQAGTQPDLTLCGADGDTDWYVIETDAEGTLTVSLNFLQSQGDLDVDVIREGSVLPENAGQPDGHGAIDGETVQLRNRPAARYYIHVYANGQPNSRYDLSITFEPREFMCSDDPDEPNNDSAAAEYLGVGQVNGRGTQWICDRAPRDEDWFQIDVPAGLLRTVLTSFTYGDDGDLFIEVYDADMLLQATTSEISRGVAKQCIVVEESVDPRTFFVRVMPLAVNTVLGDERLDYQLYLLNGEDCDAVGLPAVGVEWPRVP